MISNDTSNMVMPVSPMYGGGNSGSFGNSFGGDWAWIILLLLLAGNGWGNNNNSYGGGNGGVLPYMWNTATQNDVNRGFDSAATAGQLSNIQNAINNGFSSAEIANCNRAMDAMNQRFADVQAMNQSFNNLSSQFAQCCCENRLAVANLGADIAREACADRQAVNEGVRDIIANQTASTQRILDQLCNDKIDAKNEKIADLERQLTMANFAASQASQNAFIQKGFSDEVDALYNRLASCPVPSEPVYGRTPIFTCNQNAQTQGCGCGM